MGMAMSQIQREIARGCKGLENIDYVPQEKLEVIATDVFIRIRLSEDGEQETMLISGIRAALFQYVKALGIQVLPINNGRSSGRLDGPVDVFSVGRSAPD
ncbi:hypothetical protein [Vreelandella utahensis]|uniref:hypothetical protein n=1 Tax=Vreelandella halophila TaxID=86177 RepID=UPI0009865EAF|nr:hypothetical protein [Halomonas utahensis]